MVVVLYDFSSVFSTTKKDFTSSIPVTALISGCLK
jgi:hypothetical protein